MAYQQPGGISPGGAAGALDQHGPQGAEYTLQGVMRFLQVEWHNHERARNAWDIERAEMKAKVAKLEGESRHSKKINEQLERQIRMLETALKNERAKNRGQALSADTSSPQQVNHVDQDKASKPPKAAAENPPSSSGMESAGAAATRRALPVHPPPQPLIFC